MRSIVAEMGSGRICQTSLPGWMPSAQSGVAPVNRKESDMALADRIKACRKNAGLSQAELAERLLVSRQAVTKWESGRGYPDIQNLKSMGRSST